MKPRKTLSRSRPNRYLATHVPVTGRRVLDFVLYVLIGLAIALGGMIYAFRFPSDESVGLSIKWISLLAGTAIVFGLRVRKRRGATSRPLLLCLLFVHLAILVAVIYHWPQLRLIWLFVIMGAESAAMSLLDGPSGTT